MRKVLLSRISFSALMLTFLTFIFLFFNFTSAGNWDKPLSGGGSFVYVNENTFYIHLHGAVKYINADGTCL